MDISRADIADFVYFMAIARWGSFRRASSELDVTPSALSHAIRGLEERLGVRLLNRTTRSVTLTAAGEELRASIESPFHDITEARERLNRYRDAPAGRVRINMPEDAFTLLVEPVMPAFIERYPEVEVDISITNRLIDVVDEGFDAGIRYGGTVPEDMVAQKLSPEIIWSAAASPEYLEKNGTPEHPADLRRHRCIRIRLGNDKIYDWEFGTGAQEMSVTTPGQITVDHTNALLNFGCAGLGVIYATLPVMKEALNDGRLRLILEDWASPGEGFHIYYSSRRQVPNGLRLLIETIREMKPLG